MENKRTCLYDRHVALGAKISPYGGFEMPISYTTLEDEHRAVRTACGMFDVSHMGEVTVCGVDAERFVNHIFTNDAATLAVGHAMYGLMLHDDGGTVDDLLVYRTASDGFFLVVNAANIDKDWQWIVAHSEGYNIRLRNRSEDYGQLAVQGPEAEAVVVQVLGIACADLAFYTWKSIGDGDAASDVPAIISRTGYTGEDGFELYGSKALVERWWDALLESRRCVPCGLGCRDTLRFEVGLPLYGNELSAEISPMMAGLGSFCKLDKEEFIGREAIAKQKADGPAAKVVGLRLDGKAIARHGYGVEKDGVQVGTVTTGYRSISTGESVCMALVDARCAALGTEVDVRIRNKTFRATVVKKRFYDKHYKK